jgi:tetratricopeptide (TPR) repeat protein
MTAAHTEPTPLEIYDQARFLIDQGELDEAYQLARVLHKMGFTGTFEIEALVCRARGDLDRAAEVLEKGLRISPQVWPNHLLLGSTYSDLGRFEEAQQAYENALKCQAVDADWVHYNQSVCFAKQSRFEEALEVCPSDPADPALLALTDIFRLGLLNELGRSDKVIQLARFLLEEIESAGNESVEGLPKLADVHYQLAWALFHGSQDLSAAEDHVILALKNDFYSEDGQLLLEEIVPPESMECRRFALRMEANLRKPIPEENAPAGKLTVLCQVVAEDQQSAMQLYKASETPGVAAAAQARQVDDRGPFPDRYKGVFAGPDRYLAS